MDTWTAGRRFTEPSPTFLTRTLAITEARVIIHEAAQANSGHLTLIRTEPACWRSWTLPNGARRWLKPDLEAITTTAQGDEDHWLLEIDLGTENPARLLTKSHNYQDHLATGLEQATTGGYYPQVIWTMSSTNRATRLRQAITNDPGLTNELFRVVTVKELAALASHSWLATMEGVSLPSIVPSPPGAEMRLSSCSGAGTVQ